MWNHILGVECITDKDQLAQSINDHAQKFSNRPECFKPDDILPLTYDLDVES